jgi:hypothetical protein
MPDPTPQVTGSDILSYRGDAGLAAGAGNGGILPQQADPFAGISGTIDAVNERQAQQRVREYQQKIKDREDLTKMLAETDGSVFNMKGENGKNVSFSPLPKDQEILTQKADELRKIMLSKPDKYMYDADYLKKKADYNTLTRHAGVRAVTYANFNQEAAKSNDPNERESILGMRRSEVEDKPLTDFHMPEPHLPRFKYDPETFISGKDLKEAKNLNTFQVSGGTDAQGNIVHTSMDGLNDNVMDFRAKIQPNSKSFSDAVNLSNGYIQAISNNPGLVISHNRNIDAINLQRGYVDQNGKILSPHFIPHVAEVVAGPNNQPVVKIDTDNPTDIAYSIMAEKYGRLQQSKEIKKDALDVEKTELGMKYTRAQIDNLKERADIARKKLELDKSKEAREQAEASEDEYAAASTVNSVYKTYTDQRNKKDFAPLSGVPQLQPVLGTIGVNANEYEFAPLNHLDDNIKDIAGVQTKNLTGAVQKAPAGPTAAYYLKSKNGISGDRIVIGVPTDTKIKDKKGNDAIKTDINWIAVSPEDAVKNKISTMKNFNVTDKTLKTISNAQRDVNDMLQGKPAKEKPATANQSNEEAAILARLVPARVKKSDGTMVDIMYDPVTKKRYAK